MRHGAPESGPGAIRADLVRFVLVESRSGGNVGSIARALKNLGYSRLALVRPLCEPLGPESRRMAVDAVDLLERTPVHATLDAALEGAQRVVGTTGRRGKHRHPHWPLDRLAGEIVAPGGLAELAVVFGREDHGLSDVDLDRCTHLVYLPASDAYPSFNLAQAVLLVAYELRRFGAPARGKGHAERPAGHEQREALYRHLEHALRTIGFLNHDGAAVVMRRLRRLLGRAGVTAAEAKMLRGMARQILWTADRAGLPLADEPDR